MLKKTMLIVLAIALLAGIMVINRPVFGAVPTTKNGLNWKELLVDITDLETQMTTSESIHTAAVILLEEYIADLESQLIEKDAVIADLQSQLDGCDAEPIDLMSIYEVDNWAVGIPAATQYSYYCLSGINPVWIASDYWWSYYGIDWTGDIAQRGHVAIVDTQSELDWVSGNMNLETLIWNSNETPTDGQFGVIMSDGSELVMLNSDGSVSDASGLISLLLLEYNTDTRETGPTMTVTGGTSENYTYIPERTIVPYTP